VRAGDHAQLQGQLAELQATLREIGAQEKEARGLLARIGQAPARGRKKTESSN
jgi:septal ring factor EnvC (AmiA/AmiB activator)